MNEDVIVDAVRDSVLTVIAAQDLCIMHHGGWLGDASVRRLADEIARTAAQAIVLMMETRLK